MTSRSSAVRRDPDRVNLAETLRFVRRNRWFLLGAVLVGASVAAATSQLRTQTYTAEAALLFDPRVVVSLPDSQDGGADIPLSQDLRSEVDMVLSHPVVTEAVGRVGLTQEALEGPSPAAGPLAPLREGLGLALGGDGRNAPSYETVREHVDAFNDGRSNTIRVEAQAPSPTLAADLANAVARSYIDQRRALTAEQMTAAKDFLGTHLADVRRQLEEAITSEQSFREQAGLLETGKGTIESQRLVDLIGQLAQVRANRARAEAKLPLLQSARGAENAAALAEVVSSINIANLTELEAQAKARESELATVFGPLHPSLQKARAELADLRGKINA
ncbi:MAG TPA: hypothetical protein VEB64_06560, partial [Azospirillaceae bacterium]|nr:hypothetical protein [Azospirillaceae bacterium]